MATIDYSNLLSGFEATLNVQQKICLEEFRQRILASEFCPDYAIDPGADRFLLKFLRATMKDKTGERLFRVDCAFDRLIRTFLWRREHNIAELRAACERNEPPEKFSLYRAIYPSLTVVNPDTGQHIRFSYFGKFISYLDTKALSDEEWLQCFAYDTMSIEKNLRRESTARGVEISTYVSVPDVSGLSLFGVAGRLDFIKIMSRNAAEHFPETLGKTFLIQCPWIFSKAFALASPFIDKDTQAKFVVCNKVPFEEFERLIPKSLWPKDYGGEGPQMQIPLHCS